MPLIKRSVNISGHATSITLEPEFLTALLKIAETKTVSLDQLVTEIDDARGDYNLSSAIRVYILNEISNG